MIGRHPPFTDQEAAAYLGCTALDLERLLAAYPVPRYPVGPEKGKLMANCFLDIAQQIVDVSRAAGGNHPEITQEMVARAVARGGCSG